MRTLNADELEMLNSLRFLLYFLTNMISIYFLCCIFLKRPYHKNFRILLVVNCIAGWCISAGEYFRIVEDSKFVTEQIKHSLMICFCFGLFLYHISMFAIALERLVATVSVKVYAAGGQTRLLQALLIISTVATAPGMVVLQQSSIVPNVDIVLLLFSFSTAILSALIMTFLYAFNKRAYRQRFHQRVLLAEKYQMNENLQSTRTFVPIVINELICRFITNFLHLMAIRSGEELLGRHSAISAVLDIFTSYRIAFAHIVIIRHIHGRCRLKEKSAFLYENQYPNEITDKYFEAYRKSWRLERKK